MITRRTRLSFDRLENRDIPGSLGVHALPVGALVGGAVAVAVEAPKPLFPSYPAYQNETFPYQGGGLGKNAVQQ